MTAASVVLPILIRHKWQVPMTACAIDTLFCTTDIPFELVVVETEGQHFAPGNPHTDHPYTYRHIPKRGNPNADANLGISLCKSEKVVYTGNDVFVRPDWLGALLTVFERHQDAGVATLASADLKARARDLIQEGAYGPFMMFKRGWTFDADLFPSSFGDTDLMMRVYAAGARCYRNWNVVIEHLNGQTINGPAHQADYAAALERFKVKHKGSEHLLPYRFFTEGLIW